MLGNIKIGFIFLMLHCKDYDEHRFDLKKK